MCSPSFRIRSTSANSTGSPRVTRSQRIGLDAVQLRRDEPVDRLADHLRRGVAEDPLGRLVPAGDGAIEPLADDGVIRRVHNGGQPRRHLLDADPIGHVLGHDGQPLRGRVDGDLKPPVEGGVVVLHPDHLLLGDGAAVRVLEGGSHISGKASQRLRPM